MELIWIKLLFSWVALANECSLSNLNYKKLYPHFLASGYWLQSAGNQYVTSTSLTGVGTYIYDLNNNHAYHIHDKDDFDIFGLPQGDLYILPNPIRFYAFSDLLQFKKHSQTLWSDPTMMGFYQSLGQVNQNQNNRRIRVLTAQGAGLIRDYQIIGFGNQAKIKPLGYAKDVCTNLVREKLDFTIPILSRDGRMMAIRDYDSNDLVIFQVDGVSANCKLQTKLKGATGKVNFSFDNLWVAYLRPAPEDPSNKALYIYSLLKEQSYRISSPLEKIGFMSFSPTGDLMYTREQTNQNYELVFIELSFLHNTLNHSLEDIQNWYQKCNIPFVSGNLSEFYFLLRTSGSAP